jgi:hypothetical protein
VLIARSPAKRAASAAEVSRIRPPQNHLGLALMETASLSPVAHGGLSRRYSAVAAASASL